MIERLYQGDCMEIMKALPDKSVDLTLTDIPYDGVNRYSHGLRNLDKGKADICEFDIKDFVYECIRLTTGSIYIFCRGEQFSEIRQIMVDNGLTVRTLIWEKTNPSPMNGDVVYLSGIEHCVFGKFPGGTFNGHCVNTVFRHPTCESNIHPTQKPIELMGNLYEYLQTQVTPCLTLAWGAEQQ